MSLYQPTSGELQEFSHLITGTQHNDNATRKHAEKLLNTFRTATPEKYIVLLVTLPTHTANPTIQQTTLILLRQLLVVTDNTYGQCSGQTQAYVRQVLLQLLTISTNASVNQKTIDAISMLAARYADTVTTVWPELLNTVFQLNTAGEQMKQDSALQLIASLCEYSIVAIKPHIQHILPILTTSLNSTVDTTRLYGLKATTQLLLKLEADERTQLQEIVPLLFNALGAAYSAQNDESIVSCCDVLTELAAEQPKFLKQYIQPIVSSMLAIAANDTLESGTRSSALEFLVTLSESAASMVKKQTEFKQKVVPLTCACLTSVDVDERGDSLSVTVTAGSTSDELVEQNDLFSAGCTAIQRVINSLGCKTFMSQAVPIVQQWVTDSANWKHRHAALTVIALITETEAGANIPVDQITALIQPALSLMNTDPHARVRYAALNAIAGCADAYSPQFQYAHMSSVLPAVLQATHDTVAIIQRQAALTLVNLFNGIAIDEDDVDIDVTKSEATLQSHRERVLQRLFEMIQGNNLDTAESAVRAVSSLAVASGSAIAPYYTTLMPGLKSIVTNASAPEQTLLRSTAIDGIGILAEAVGAQTFAPDAAPILDACIALLHTLNPGDDQYQSVSECIGRVARIVKAQFAPYLPSVIPQLIKSAQITDAASFMDQSEAAQLGDRAGYESMTLDLKEMGVKHISVNTTLLQEKTNATKMLYNYANDLGATFFPYVQQTALTLIPNLMYAYSDTIRYSAVAALPALMNSAAQHFDALHQGTEKSAYMRDLWSTMFEPLQTAIRAESDCESLNAISRSFIECVEVLPFALTEQQVTLIHETYAVIVDDCVDRVQQYDREQYDDDVDEEDKQVAAQQLDQENNLLGCFYDLHAKILKRNGQSYLPMFHKQMADKYTNMLTVVDDNANEPLEPLLTTGFCVLAQMVNDCGINEITGHYASQLLEPAVASLTSPINDLRHAANFTIGACAAVLGHAMQSVLPLCIKGLTQCIRAPNSRNAENEPATDNAISAVSKIVRYCNVNGDMQSQLLQLFVSALPCRENGDVEEACNVHEALMYFVEHNYTQLVGADSAQLPQLVNVIAQLSAAPELLLPATKVKIAQFVHQLQQRVSAQQLQQMIVDKTSQEALYQLINSSSQVTA